MIDISMEMEQHDCPFIDTTLDHDIAFSTMHWTFDESDRTLETRMVVQGESPSDLNNGLQSLRDHPNMYEFRLQKRWKDTAQIRTNIDETDAMERIRSNDGYITGPFYIEDGSELWHVGFDTNEDADDTLSELDRRNEFGIISREKLDDVLTQEGIQSVVAGLDLVSACQSLTDVERKTLETAVELGYFETPRDTTLDSLADEFDVSSPAVSKNIRRGQKKIMSSAVEALKSVDK